MRAVKSRGTKLEVGFGRKLREIGIKFRRNVKSCFGKPDFANKKNKMAIFIDSCFWHGCRFHCRMPKSHARYWNQKIERNKERDRQVVEWYQRHEWHLFRFWEHSLKVDVDKCLSKIKKNMKTKLVLKDI